MAIETKRGYITKQQVEDYCDISITDNSEAVEKMEIAEEIIDQYVGFQNSFLRYDVTNRASDGTTLSLTDTNSNSPINSMTENYFSYCMLDIIGGTNAGESRLITASSTSGVLTVHKAFTSAIDSTSVYRIYQLAKFPRGVDYEVVNNIYYKYVPENIKLACLAQMEYMAEMGQDFFMDTADKSGESMDGYSYQMRNNRSRMIAPKAKEYLRGFVNRKGNLIV
jgi:hypothetical protein